MTKKSDIYKKIKEENGIILKKVVNAQEELSKAWIYLYPIRSARETFSVPLSLIEAIQVGTPYITTNVGGVLEYFDEIHAVPAGDAGELVGKIEEFISKPIVLPLRKKIDYKKTAEEYMKLY